MFGAQLCLYLFFTDFTLFLLSFPRIIDCYKLWISFSFAVSVTWSSVALEVATLDVVEKGRLSKAMGALF